jgi:ubiquinol-cytochrome c reductase iron-sulfur subunit
MSEQNSKDNADAIAISQEELSEEGQAKRDFAVMAASSAAVVGTIAGSSIFVKSLSPDKGTLAVGATEVDLSGVKEGESIVVKWRGTPVFIKHRTQAEIQEVQNNGWEKFKDPQPDGDRTIKGQEKWLVVIGVCTHLGCVPNKSDGGWFCPCHGSVYDASGRIVKGPAPENLPIPPYEFLSDTTIKIG